MNKIETKILNCSAIQEAEKNMVFTARLTQRGHLIHNMEDLVRLYNTSFTNDTVRNMGSLPHPTIQKFSVITVAVVGASRRFLSQITRHQNEVKFTSASLQYSNYSGEAAFVKPYEILTAPPDIQELYERNNGNDTKASLTAIYCLLRKLIYQVLIKFNSFFCIVSGINLTLLFIIIRISNFSIIVMRKFFCIYIDFTENP